MGAESPGEIITFYSYKGGAGRTMALANVACLFAQSQNEPPGRRVLMVDWDLEAPGLHRFFRNKFQRLSTDRSQREKLLSEHPGVIDLFRELDSLSPSAKDQSEEVAAGVLDRIKLDRYVLETDIPGLSLLKAGRFGEGYPSRVNSFNWEALYNRSPWLIRGLAERLADRYEYVLIDSRTGLTDISGICTSLMPSILVVVFTPSRQSLTGLTELVQRATEYRKQSSDLRPLLVFPLPSRIEATEPTLRELWRFGDSEQEIVGYQPEFEALFQKIYGLKQCELDRYFEEVQVQHIPRYAYGEEIAVLTERDDRFSLSRSYKSLADRLLRRAYPWQDLPGATEPAPALGPLPGGSYMPCRPMPSFVDREEQLRSLARDLPPTVRAVPIVALVGAAGIGKSQLAVEYAYRFGRLYDAGVFWIQMDSPENAVGQIVNCGKAASILTEQSQGYEQLAEQAQKVRQSWEDGRPRLLIFNDVTDPSLVEVWRPRSGKCSVIVVSRNAEWEQGIGLKILQLSGLPRASSVALLAQVRPSIETDPAQRNVADAICERLGDSPLALSVAAAQLSKYKSEALDRYLLALSDPPLIREASRKSMWASFALSYSKLDVQNKVDALGLELFHTLATLDKASVSRELLALRLQMNYHNEKNRARVDEAVARLSDLGLAVEDATGCVLMHSLVREFARSLPPPKLPGEQEITEPVNRVVVASMVEYIVFSVAICVYLLLKVWPRELPEPEVRHVPLLWGRFIINVSPQSTRAFISIVCGALGSFVRLATVLVSMIKQRFAPRRWWWRFVLLVPIGSTLGLLLNFTLIAGFFSANAGSAQASVYGLAAVASLAGMFADEFTRRLRQVFDSLFSPSDRRDRAS